MNRSKVACMSEPESACRLGGDPARHGDARGIAPLIVGMKEAKIEPCLPMLPPLLQWREIGGVMARFRHPRAEPSSFFSPARRGCHRRPLATAKFRII
jgi:hypothetical protein